MKRVPDREPLWASSLADQPRPDDDVIARVVEEPEDDDPPASVRQPRERPPAGRRALAVGAVAAVGIGVLATALEGRGAMLIETVPSGWGDVPMSCDTVRIEQGDRAVERFRCRAVGGRPLPAGSYHSPESQWTSDITRRNARRSHVVISDDGDVEGWATYGP